MTISWPSIWRDYDRSKRPKFLTSRHGVTSHKIWIFYLHVSATMYSTHYLIRIHHCKRMCFSDITRFFRQTFNKGNSAMHLTQNAFLHIFSRIRKQKLHHRAQTSSVLDPTVSQSNPVHTLAHLLMFYFNINVPSTSRFPKWSLAFRSSA